VKPNNHQKIPKEMRYVSTNHAIRVVYEYATAKVWIDTHHIKECLSKRKGQIIVETWHGGLGIKKLELDVPLFQQPQYAYIREIVRHTVECADIFLSNSDHLTKIYRRAFEYKGVIWKSGYPKNDVIIHNDIAGAKKKCYAYYSLQDDIKVVVYAPTYRDEHREDEAYLNQVYNLDGRNLCNELGEKFGGRWKMLIRLHPVVNVEVLKCMTDYSEFVIDATEYPDMQELILASDIFVSDYSSCIFDAALRNIPCFTFATDFEEYKADRGVYYEMEELPFPYAKNNEELVENIRHFNYEEYIKKWEAFKVRTGLYETGHAAKDIAYVINEYIKGNTKPLEDIQSEP
jgi:CDP-glycerol glycerophosphotransferase